MESSTHPPAGPQLNAPDTSVARNHQSQNRYRKRYGTGSGNPPRASLMTAASFPKQSSASDSVSTTATISSVKDMDFTGFESTHAIPIGHEADQNFLMRIVVDVLAFTYRVKQLDLEVALLGCSLHGRMRAASNRNGRRSVLTFDDTVFASYLGRICVEMCGWHRYSHDGSPDPEKRKKLLDNVVRPAQTWGIDPGYFLDKLMEFERHRCIPGKEKETLLYSETSRKFGLNIFKKKWTNTIQHRALAERLAADGFVVRTLFPQEEVGTIISTAIAKFAKRHCKHDMHMVTPRPYANPIAISLGETLWNNWRLEMQDRQDTHNDDHHSSHNNSTVRSTNAVTGARSNIARSASQLSQGVFMSQKSDTLVATPRVSLTTQLSTRSIIHSRAQE
ncbi:hypothetical protein FB567DRAFT_284872 [Paraphoma chrysanthemicola]|uniref:Uncharacterized protein n=1 Tax=Paraphoma chrysanthemicola TaxID=798071 RepID=A0A8K0RD23_9PLEO|nr:hypothetical protein FB567DRAFT_284872 [Paraphoma chrysanthemicola]